MRKTLFVMLAISMMMMCLATSVFATTYPPDIDLTASAWQFRVESAPTTLSNDAAGGLYFDFPVEPDRSCTIIGDGVACHFVNYLYTDHVPGSVSGMVSIRMRVDVLSGYPGITFQDTQFDGSACSDNPPSVRAMLWGSTTLNDKRFWSHDYAFALDPMEWNPTNGWTVTVNIPIDPALWSDQDGSYGTQNMTAWNQTVNHTKRLALTFGGHCNYGHGIFVMGGTARFTIENYEIMPLPPNCPATSPCPGIGTNGDCIRGKDTGDTNASTSRCLQGDTSPPLGGSLVDCGSQSVHVITTTCKRAPCCLTVPPTCTCFTSCPGGGVGSYLECH
jgi:hypothetical protein